MIKQRHTSAYMVWSCVVLFYLYQYILRISPGVMADDLMAAFRVSASGFSSLSAFALYSYGLMQIPIGILVDHYGTRRMILSSITMCVAGVMLFSFCEQLAFAYLARLLMGVGSACAFLSVSKTVNEWFPDNRKGMMMGLSAAFGTLGALLGGPPLVGLIESQGWRNSLLVLAAAGIGVLLFNFFGLPRIRKGTHEIVPGEEQASFKELMAVFRSTQAWLFGFVAVGIYLAISVVADLWGVSFVMEKFAIGKSQAAQMNSFIYIGTAIGCPLFPWLSRRLGSLRKTLIIGATGVISLLAYLVFVPHIPLWTAKIAFFGIGLCTGAEILCFIGACNIMGPEVAGTMTGFLNCIVTLTGAMVQQNVGIVLDCFWDGAVTTGGVPQYSVYTYKIAFTVIIFFTVISTVLSCFIKPVRKI